MEHQPHKDSLPSGQYERQRKDEVNFAAKGLAHHPPKDGQNKKDSPHKVLTSNIREKHSHGQHHSEDDKPTNNWEEVLNRHHGGVATSVEGPSTAEPAVTMSAKAQDDFKRAINTLGVKYKFLYHPGVPKRDRIYKGNDWSELSDDDAQHAAPTAPMQPQLRGQRWGARGSVDFPAVSSC